MSNIVLRPQTMPELFKFAEIAARSNMVPQGFKNKPDDIVLAVQMGHELGLAPMQALQNIAVINGRPSVWGDALIGMCRASPLCEDIVETIEGDGMTMVATCIAKRRGSSPVTSVFSMADAKAAGLAGKAGPWTQYPKRMMQQRARGFALRDAFPDILRGLITAEEAEDTPTAAFTGTTIEAEPQTRETINAETAPKPVDHITLIRDRLAACEDAACVLRVGDAWAKMLEKAAAAGRPTTPTITEMVSEMLADRYAFFVDGTDADPGAAHEVPVDA